MDDGSSESATSENSIDRLFGTSTNGPDQRPSDKQTAHLRVSSMVIRQNFNALDDFVDGELAEDAIFITYKTPKTRIPYLYQHIHNYLSSLYSFHEQLFAFLNQHSNHHLPEYAFSPKITDDASNQYIEKYAFLLGLRHEIQHGDFECLRVDDCNTAGPFTMNQVQFNEEAFQESEQVDHNRHLRFSDIPERKYPLNYIHEFHIDYYNQFREDLFEWINMNG